MGCRNAEGKGTVVLCQPGADMRTCPHTLSWLSLPKARGSMWAAALAEHSIEGTRDCLMLKLITASGTCTMAAGCATNSRISNKRSPSLRVRGGGSNQDRLWGSNEVTELQTGSNCTNHANYCPGSSPSSFGSHPEALGLAVPEKSPA